MTHRMLAACTALVALVALAACGADDSDGTAAPRTTVSDAPSPSTTPTDGPGRVAVDPKTQFISYRTTGSAASGQARVVGTLTDLDGCLVLEPGHRPVAFDADHTELVGDTLVLGPRMSGLKTLRIAVGDKLEGAGGYSDFNEVRSNPSIAVPRACAALGTEEIAFVESW